MKLAPVFPVLVLALSMTACSKERVSPASDSAPLAVTTLPASQQDLPDPFEAGGVVRARAVAQIVSRIMAPVQSVRVSPGDRVRSGQVLVVLDGRDLEANRQRAAAARSGAVESSALADADVHAAEAGLNLARLTFARIRDLHASKSATQQEFDEAETQLKAAESRLKVAQARVAEARAGIESASAAAEAAAVASSYATLVAPFDGLVTEKLVDPGNMAAPGMPVITVEDTRSFRLDVRVDESRAALVRIGDPVEVRLDSAAPQAAGEPAPNARLLAGRVSELARMLDPGSHDFLVKVDLPDTEQLRSGMFARAVFSGPVHRALAVPQSALVRRGQLSFVYVVDEGRARLRLVNAAEPVGDHVEVRSGLVDGEQVVTSPPPTLVDGRSVTASRESGR